MNTAWLVLLAHLMGIGPSAHSVRWPLKNPAWNAQNAARFTVVPPGPVSDRGRVELRLAIPKPGADSRPICVSFYRDRVDLRHLIADQIAADAHGDFLFARAWWTTAGQAGKHRLLYRIEGDGSARRTGGAWPLEVVSSQTSALPMFQGVWIEPFAALQSCRGKDAQETERNLRDSIDSMQRLGMTTLVITYVEYNGTIFYPSRVSFYDRDVKRMVSTKDCPIDLVETILSQADRNGMHVFLGLGRGGDTYLLWEFQKPGWQQRCVQDAALSQRIAQELWQNYGSHPSFYGWYFTHEMDDLAKSSAYYDPVADFCHSLSPDKPVMVAPAGTPVMTRETLAASHVDIFAYQDAVGSGYVPYKNTFHPDNRIAMLDAIYTRYRDWHLGLDKHLWADLEVWEMDGSQGYGGSYPPKFDRVRRQIEIEKGYVEMLTAYAYHGFLQDPRSRHPADDPRAVRLYQDYADYLARLRKPNKASDLTGR